MIALKLRPHYSRCMIQLNDRDLPIYGVRIVDDIILPDGKIVCTVWNGRFFSTGVYSSHFHPLVVGDRIELWHKPLDEATYSTEEQALAGHKTMADKWTKASEDD